MFGELWKAFWERVKTEWSALKAAPVSIAALLLIGVVAGYQGASWRYSGVTDVLTADNTSLKYKLDHVPQQSTQADPDGLYQLSKQVGETSGMIADLGHSQLSFASMVVDGDFDPHRDVEYRDYILHFDKFVPTSVASMVGMGTRAAANNVTARIVSRK